MAFAMLHSFNNKEFYKLSYTNSAVGTYEARQAEAWANFDNWQLEWAVEFENAALAKAFKSQKAKGQPRTKGLGLSNDYIATYVDDSGHEELSKITVFCAYANASYISNKEVKVYPIYIGISTASEELPGRYIWKKNFSSLKEAEVFHAFIKSFYEVFLVPIHNFEIYMIDHKSDLQEIIDKYAERLRMLELEKKLKSYDDEEENASRDNEAPWQ